MGLSRVAARMVAAGMLAGGMSAAWGQGYPHKFLRILTAAPGSANFSN